MLGTGSLKLTCNIIGVNNRTFMFCKGLHRRIYAVEAVFNKAGGPDVKTLLLKDSITDIFK